jgi:hypothetical protein
VTLLEGQDATTTKEALSSLKAGATLADISAAMGTGMRMLLSEGGGRLVVISDFTNGKEKTRICKEPCRIKQH